MKTMLNDNDIAQFTLTTKAGPLAVGIHMGTKSSGTRVFTPVSNAFREFGVELLVDD